MFGYKKITALLTALLICFPAMPSFTARADDDITTESAMAENTSGDFVYSVIGDSEISIDGYNGTEKDITIPETIDGYTVTELSSKAFGSTPDQPYESIYIPSTVSRISEDNPFIYCLELKEITVSPDNKDYKSVDGILYSADGSKLVCYPSKKEGKEFDVPDGIKEIGIAGIYSTELEKINFPSSLEYIDRFGLSGNASLKSADFSGTALQMIDIAGLGECSSLNEVKFPDTLSEICVGAFLSCSSLEEVTLPESLVSVGQYAFTGTALKMIIVPDSVTSIGYGAFGYSDEETPVDDFVIIGSYGSEAHRYSTDSDEEYGYANNFTFATLDSYKETLEYNSLDKSMYEDFEYTVINGDAVITRCYSVDMVVEVPEEINGIKVTRIYTGAFEDSQAEEIIIPECVKTIDKLAFYNCQYMRSLSIMGAETIGESAFVMCDSLENLTISGDCKEIQDEEPFMSCGLLQSINITEGNGSYSSENGVLYNKEKTTLIAYPCAKTESEFRVPSGVKEIGVSAFCNNANLKKADLTGVERIGAYAFEGSRQLNKAVFSDSLKSVEIYAFADCPSLKSVRLYKSTDEISDYSFGYVFDSSGNSAQTDNMTLLEGFTIYADDDTTAYNYAKACGIEVVSGTVELFGKNVVKGFLWAVGGIAAVLAGGGAGFAVFRKSRKKKGKTQ